MILTDPYENVRLFGAKIDSNLITAKVAWVNRNASRIVKVADISNPTIWYTLNLGSKFSGQPIDSIVEHIYLPIVK